MNIQNFPTLSDEPNASSAEEKDELALSYSDQSELLKKRLKMKSMFHTNDPPAIATDLFSSAAVEENVKNVVYEGSGEGVDETEPSTTIDYFNIANNSAVEDAVVESSSNSSTLNDQNTSDAQVETVSDTLYQKTEAEVNAILQTSQSKYDGQKEDEAVDEGTKSTDIVDSENYPGNETNCESDQDCSQKNQYCDLGKCNCQPGYQQNMRQSGVCEVEQGILVL
uniref:EB domain-containing protein n=1 Tax=Caenorhabditis tropicalis TaxID=1561998 RepID=A0A1I7UQ82_9PELO